MTYKVLINFTDLQDDRHYYAAGDTYPREGLKPTEARIEELSGVNNAVGTAIIEVVAEAEVEPKEAGATEETKADAKAKDTKAKAKAKK